MKFFFKALMSLLLVLMLTVALPAVSPAKTKAVRLLDAMEDVNAWQVGHSDEVKAALHADSGALRLDFDFNGTAGFAFLRRSLPLSFTGNYALSLRVRGEAPANTLQLKLIDASGENVWWINRPDFVFTGAWQTLRAEKRQIDFAWGPAKDRRLRQAAAIEITVAAGKGGSGRIWFDDLKLEPLPAPPAVWPQPTVSASSALPAAAAHSALDGNPETAWRSDPATGARQTLTIDFGAVRPFGGLVLHWLKGRAATRYTVAFSKNGQDWRTVRRVTDGNGGADPLLLPESHTRYVRLEFERGQARGYGLSEIEVKDLSWGATPNNYFEALARKARRGLYPRGFSGQQSYWTIVGVNGGGADAALVSEDGALELDRGGFSVEPFLLSDGRLLTWADVSADQKLADGYLPIPTVTWKAPDLALHIQAFAAGSRADSDLLARYSVENRSPNPRKVTLALAVRPFQVNPPTQFLNIVGGVSPIRELAWDGRTVSVNGQACLFPLQTPDAFTAAGLDAGEVAARLAANNLKPSSHARDASGYASGAMLFNLELPAGGQRTIDLLAPLTGAATPPDAAGKDPDAWTVRQRETVAAGWRSRLNAVSLNLPGQAREIGNTLRTSLAYILISRNGPALQPGTRAYARSWIRDGAMMAEALLRLGHADIVRDFIGWYAPHQFADGKVPCCVDWRGSDPVPENDSQGELLFTITELYRFTHDRAELEKLWPHAAAAVDYMNKLRSTERTSANLSTENRAFYGLMPASISHEGYAAKPVHSYWDDFWALRGYDDAAYLARALGKPDAARITAARDQFRADLHASIMAAVKQHGLDYVPGCAELGDFDATSTTVVLSPGVEQNRLPQNLLQNTFERYWREFVARRSDPAGTTAYTPYELRAIAAFTRLGLRSRVQALIDFFMADRRPAQWNGWAEVVRGDERSSGFIGDMPHAWIASDYIRSILDMFAYRRNADSALVLAAGVPTPWLDGQGVGISGLNTPWGRLDYTLRREGDRLYLRLDAEAVPPGGFVLPWPYAGAPGEAQIDGREASWQNGELKIDATHADVSIKIPEKDLQKNVAARQHSATPAS